MKRLTAALGVALAVVGLRLWRVADALRERDIDLDHARSDITGLTADLAVAERTGDDWRDLAERAWRDLAERAGAAL